VSPTVPRAAGRSARRCRRAEHAGDTVLAFITDRKDGRP